MKKDVNIYPHGIIEVTTVRLNYESCLLVSKSVSRQSIYIKIGFKFVNPDDVGTACGKT